MSGDPVPLGFQFPQHCPHCGPRQTYGAPQDSRQVEALEKIATSLAEIRTLLRDIASKKSTKEKKC